MKRWKGWWCMLVKLPELGHSVDDLLTRVAALEAENTTLRALAPLVNLDDAGNLHINLPADGSFTLRQGDVFRIAVDNAGNAGFYGAQQVGIYSANGQVSSNGQGVTIAGKDGAPMLWLHPDGRIQAVGSLEADDGTA